MTSDKERAREIAYGWYQFYINAGVQERVDDYRKEQLLDWIARTLAAVRGEATSDCDQALAAKDAEILRLRGERR